MTLSLMTGEAGRGEGGSRAPASLRTFRWRWRGGTECQTSRSSSPSAVASWWRARSSRVSSCSRQQSWSPLEGWAGSGWRPRRERRVRLSAGPACWPAAGGSPQSSGSTSPTRYSRRTSSPTRRRTPWWRTWWRWPGRWWGSDQFPCKPCVWCRRGSGGQQSDGPSSGSSTLSSLSSASQSCWPYQ